jgi:hypothetical protein
METREIKCQSCGTMNRIPNDYAVTQRPRCGKCKIALPESFLVKAGRTRRRWPNVFGLLFLLLFLWGGGLILFVLFPSDGTSPSPPRSGPRIIESAPVNLCVEQPSPRQGVYQNYDRSPRLIKFTIKTASGSNYFVKLAEAGSNLPVMTFFVNGGSSITEYVPLGNFILKYTTGRSWCGDNDIFGTDADTFEANEEFLFDENSPGWIVELIYQPGGNLQTHRIPRSEF